MKKLTKIVDALADFDLYADSFFIYFPLIQNPILTQKQLFALIIKNPV